MASAKIDGLVELIENGSNTLEVVRVNENRLKKLRKRAFNMKNKRTSYFSASYHQRRRFKIKFKQMIEGNDYKEYLKSHGLKCQKIILSSYDPKHIDN